MAEKICLSQGLTVVRNKPYSGGFTTQNYGRPFEGVHVIQVEIKRSLYMDEKKVERHPEMLNLTAKMRHLIRAFTLVDPSMIEPKVGLSLSAAE